MINNNSGNIYSYAQITNQDAREKVFEELQKGIARFGNWDQSKSLKDKWYCAHQALLRIQPGDWIVHVNMPSYGQCTTTKVVSEYQWDDGISVNYGNGNDFGNHFNIDKDTLLTFNRRDNNVVPSINLEPRRRIQRVYQEQDFFTSLENLKSNKHRDIAVNDTSIIHIQEKANALLEPFTILIQQMNKSKEFERLLHCVFEQIANTTAVLNGFGWKSDFGTYLLVEFQSPLPSINITKKLVVQVKSYENKISDCNAIDQIILGISKFEADGGLLFTAAEKTEKLENYIVKKAEEHKTNIDVISGTDVVRFILRYAPDILLGKNN